MQPASQWDRMDRSNVVKTTDELKFTIPELGYFLLPAIEFKIYRVTLVVADLGWVDFDLDVPPNCLAAQPVLPNSH